MITAGAGPYPQDFPFTYNVAPPGQNGKNNAPVSIFTIGIQVTSMWKII